MRKTAPLKFFAAMSAFVMLTPTALADNIVGQTAVLRALDKVTATTKDFNVPVGHTLNYGTLEVTVRHCEIKPPEDIPETFVFVQVMEHSLDKNAQSDEPEQIFSGWMFGSDPAMSPLEHPVYDVWPIACIDPIPLEEEEE